MINEIPQEIKFSLVFDERVEEEWLNKVHQNIDSESAKGAGEEVESDEEALLP
jgi:hypothetical protein